MKIFSYILNVTLSLAFILSPSSWSKASSDPLQFITTQFQTHKTYRELIKTVNESSPIIGTKLEKYFLKHSYLDQKIPALKLENDHFILTDFPEGKFKLDPTNSTITFFWKGQKVFINDVSNFDEISKKIESIMVQKKFSFMSLFIEDAHAVALIVDVITVFTFLGISIYGLNGVRLELEFIKKTSEIKKNCPKQFPSMNAYTEMLDNLKKLNLNVCIPGDTFLFKGYNKEACDDLNSAIQCYEKTIKEIQATNDTDRSTPKKEIKNNTTPKKIHFLPPNVSEQ